MRHAWLIGMTILVLGCGSGGGDSGGDVSSGADTDPGVEVETEIEADSPPLVEYRPVVFSVVSDIHLEGGYDTPIAQNVVGLFEEAAAMSPSPEFMVVTGDLVNFISEPADTGTGSCLEALRRIFREGPLPTEVIAGNHEYYTAQSPALTLVDDRAGRDALLEEVLAMPRWFVTEHGGTRFIYINTMQGDLWDISNGLNGSAGREQLEWVDGLLSDGRPAILFMHHPPSMVLEDDEISIDSTIADHSENILAVFAGHLHLWASSEYEGVPIYLTDAGWDGTGIHHVRVDPDAGTVEILNEALIDYGELEVYDCEPDEEEPLGDLSSFDGSLLELLITDAVAEPAGFGTYLEEAISMVPMIFSLRAPDPSGLAIPALLAAGRFEGNGAPGKPAYVAALEDGTCLPMSFAVDDPCVSTSPVTLTFDLGQVFNLPLQPGWQIQMDLDDLTFEGILNSKPGISEGLLHTTVDLSPGVMDIKEIVVGEYCADAIPGCQPGAEGMPPCGEAPTWEFFDEIPTHCDVAVSGIGIRMVLAMLETVPDYKAWVDANFMTYAATESDDGAPGHVDPAMFAPPPDGNCQQ